LAKDLSTLRRRRQIRTRPADDHPSVAEKIFVKCRIIWLF